MAQVPLAGTTLVSGQDCSWPKLWLRRWTGRDGRGEWKLCPCIPTAGAMGDLNSDLIDEINHWNIFKNFFLVEISPYSYWKDDERYCESMMKYHHYGIIPPHVHEEYSINPMNIKCSFIHIQPIDIWRDFPSSMPSWIVRSRILNHKLSIKFWEQSHRNFRKVQQTSIKNGTTWKHILLQKLLGYDIAIIWPKCDQQ